MQDVGKIGLYSFINKLQPKSDWLKIFPYTN